MLLDSKQSKYIIILLISHLQKITVYTSDDQSQDSYDPIVFISKSFQTSTKKILGLKRLKIQSQNAVQINNEKN